MHATMDPLEFLMMSLCSKMMEIVVALSFFVDYYD